MSNQASLKKWIQDIDSDSLSVWREAIAQLRQLHNDVWNGVRFFVTVNGIIIAAAFGISKLQGRDAITGILIVLLAVAGLLLTLTARTILTRHRKYYLQMLYRKTMIERELGLYDVRLVGSDLSFPWNVEGKYIPCMESDPSGWRDEQMRRKGTITRLLFLVYEGVICAHLLILIAAVIGLWIGYFR